MISVSLAHYLTLCIFLLFLGLYGVLVNRRQILALFLASEISFSAGLLLFVVFSKYQQNLKGQAFFLIFLGALIPKTVIGIGLVLNLYKKRRISFIELEKKDDLS